MEANRILTALVILLAPVSLMTAQEKTADSLRSDLDAVKAELKSEQDRLDRLSQEIAKLSEALKERTPAVSPEPTSSVPRAAPVVAPAAGAENPGPAEATNLRSHTVIKGETLTQIAKQYGVTVPEIEQLNKIGDAKKLQAGQTIKIPPSASASPAPSPTPQNQ